MNMITYLTFYTSSFSMVRRGKRDFSPTDRTFAVVAFIGILGIIYFVATRNLNRGIEERLSDPTPPSDRLAAFQSSFNQR